MSKRRNEKTKKYYDEGSSKSNRINMRLDDKLLSMVDEVANEFGVSRSEVGRLALSGELKHLRGKRGLSAEQIDKVMTAFAKLETLFSDTQKTFHSMANNVNQIAKKVNGGGTLSDQDKETLEICAENSKKIAELLDEFSERFWGVF
jgi:metal-responsive CopG/Arc/MetJ family transcriptional regulator